MAFDIKKTLVSLFMGANAVSIAVMCLVAYSGFLPPMDFPLLSNLQFVFPLMLLINLGFVLFWVIFRLRNIWLPIVGFLLVIIPLRAYCPINGKPQSTEGAMKVISYNICGFHFQGEEHQTDILEFLKKESADIVCLQEMTQSVAQQQEIRQSLRAEYPYSEFVKISSKGECVGVFSKLPIDGYEIIPYQSAGNLSVAYRLSAPEGTIYLINNHLESVGLSMKDKGDFEYLVSGDADRIYAKAETKLLIQKIMTASAIRGKQARAVAKFIHDHQGERIICCGDFNDPPLSYTRQTIGRELNDCYIAAGNGPGWSFSAHKMLFRIDNILCSDHWETARCEIDNSQKNSDHYPIISWLLPTREEKNAK